MIDQILETLIKAGNVIYFIIFISIYAWFLIIKKYFFLKNETAGGNIFLNQIYPFIIRKDKTALDDFLKKEKKIIAGCLLEISGSRDLNDMEARTALERSYYFGLLNDNMGTLATLAAIAPLLGLLGTVTGMMKTFGVIRLFGSANPALMADGISEALLTTQAGLVVAFPIILTSAFLKTRIKDLKDNFEKVYIKLKGQYNA
jgi:biopolymer transport protein ExbB